MTEALCNNTRAFYRPKRGEGYHGASYSVFGIKTFLSRQKILDLPQNLPLYIYKIVKMLPLKEK